jgi:hypothetical protein
MVARIRIMEYRYNDLAWYLSFTRYMKDQTGMITSNATIGNQRISKIAPTRAYR